VADASVAECFVSGGGRLFGELVTAACLGPSIWSKLDCATDVNFICCGSRRGCVGDVGDGWFPEDTLSRLQLQALRAQRLMTAQGLRSPAREQVQAWWWRKRWVLA
jgi:hypothetical protein